MMFVFGFLVGSFISITVFGMIIHIQARKKRVMEIFQRLKNSAREFENIQNSLDETFD